MVQTSIQKMRKTNAKIKAELEKHGFRDITWFPMTRFQKDVYLDNIAFDGVGIGKNEEIVLIQAKSNQKCPKKLKEAFEEFWHNHSVRALWANWRDYEGLELWPNILE